MTSIMEDYYIIAFGLIFACSLLYNILSKIRSKNLPPGPSTWPIIGNIHLLLGDKPHISLAKLSQIYGPIMTLRLGQVTTIVISSSTMAKQVLQKQDLAFSNRFTPDALKAHNLHKFSVAWLPVCPQWRTLRRILNTNLLSSTRLDANQYLNSLSNTLFSRDLVDLFRDTKVELKEAISSIAAEFGKTNLVDFFPILEKIDPQGIRRRTEFLMSKLLRLFDDLINERLEERRISGCEKSDVLEELLNISAENPKEFDHNHIKATLLDFFGARGEISASTLEWTMAEIFRQPEIVKKAQVELAEVIRKGKQVEEDDISKLPYLQCILKETLRMHPPVPFLVPRKVEEDVEVCGYIVPKGSQVLVNVWAIGRDSTFWEDPLVFKPERFWSSNLDMRGQDFELIPFGAGRRLCPGMTLALRMVTVMVGSLLNNFNWKLECGISPNKLNMEEKFGIALAKAQPLRAIPSPL